ncbi:phosphoribosylanthranilate isomerase [Actinokineospora bangkokensis]|uniref:N-(5'-phosphoribosyl)anthranilate isomerase n=1 Tax=Actinokineospora bangkokensis TaxID=1193682 RepID=A0A1Q9LSQ4_9PSEU|nr:phosphoribosylanthranilate isomerase [Actinokineospora bangkokensis]OLR95039.1 phosphoribosylanthranilate isomerase [Actinokineospora bangkokensis]
MFAKICGLRTEADVEVAAEAGADAIGLVFAASPRRVDVATAARLVKATPPGVLVVGVFKDQPVDEVAELAAASGVAAVQLHGSYPREAFDALAARGTRLVRATSLTPGTETATGAWGEEMLILDSPTPGSGQRWDLRALEGNRPTGQWLLSGGLDPDNVAEAIARARPWGVDASSGIESTRGTKDHGLVRAFLQACR